MDKTGSIFDDAFVSPGELLSRMAAGSGIEFGECHMGAFTFDEQPVESDKVARVMR